MRLNIRIPLVSFFWLVDEASFCWTVDVVHELGVLVILHMELGVLPEYGLSGSTSGVAQVEMLH